MARHQPNNAEEDSTFLSLPYSTRRRIDHAFQTALRRLELPAFPQSQRDAPTAITDVDTGGGFVVEEPVTYTEGGFLIESSSYEQPDDDSDDASHIPLTLIPTALQLLDLQPDDEQVLSVFKNAASGWSSHSPLAGDTLSSHLNQEEDLVSRADWRAVSAVLLEHQSGSDEEEARLEKDDEVMSDGSPEESAKRDTDLSSNEYEDPSAAGSDSDYNDGLDTSARKPTRAKSRISSASRVAPQPASSPSELTPRQSKECRRAFALFFPDLSETSKELDTKRIMIQDISQAAAVLKEKLKLEEIVEMLEVFSSSPDKSMGLRDFERMMVITRMA